MSVSISLYAIFFDGDVPRRPGKAAVATTDAAVPHPVGRGLPHGTTAQPTGRCRPAEPVRHSAPVAISLLRGLGRVSGGRGAPGRAAIPPGLGGDLSPPPGRGCCTPAAGPAAAAAAATAAAATPATSRARGGGGGSYGSAPARPVGGMAPIDALPCRRAVTAAYPGPPPPPPAAPATNLHAAAARFAAAAAPAATRSAGADGAPGGETAGHSSAASARAAAAVGAGRSRGGRRGRGR